MGRNQTKYELHHIYIVEQMFGLRTSVTYIGLSGGHENSEVSQMTTGARSVSGINMDASTPVQTPASHHALRILPKCTFSVIAGSIYHLDERMQDC